jgi:TolB protein
MVFLRDMKTGSDQQISARKGLNIGAAWSLDGRKMAVTLSHKDNPDIYLMDIKGKILRQVTDHWGIDVSPTFSPDGKKIAYVSNRSGTPQIYIKDLQSGRDFRLSYEGRYNTSPHWSSRNRIAFSGMNEGQFDIFSINTDGTDLRKLTQDSHNNEDPCWSPDGRYIVFSSNRDGGYHLFIMNGNGQNQKRITFISGLEETSPSWSGFDLLGSY